MKLDRIDLDRLIPLASGSHKDVTRLGVDIPTRYAECFAITTKGESVRLRNRRQLIGWSMDAHRRDFFFECKEKVIRVRTDSSRLRQVRRADLWDDFAICKALSAADPRVAQLGPDANKLVAPDGSLLFIAQVQPAHAESRRPIRIPDLQPALAT